MAGFNELVEEVVVQRGGEVTLRAPKKGDLQAWELNDRICLEVRVPKDDETLRYDHWISHWNLKDIAWMQSLFDMVLKTILSEF